MQSDDKTQCLVRLQHLANKHVLKRENGTCTWGHPIQTRPEKQRNSKKQGQQFCVSHKNVCKVTGSYSDNRQRFFKPSPVSINTPKEREFIVYSGASHLLMSEMI